MSVASDQQNFTHSDDSKSGRGRRSFRRLHGAAATGLLMATTVGFASAHELATPNFISAMDGAMKRMMLAMDVQPSGNVDRDFVTTMVPHHRGAIDMAIAELRFGKDEKLKRIAQEIIVDQQQEIAAMRLALGQPLPPSTPAPTGSNHHPAMQMEH